MYPVSKLFEMHLERIDGIELGGKAIGRLENLILKGAKHPIPNDEHAPIIFIQIELVRAMVHPVQRGTVENLFEPTHFADDLCMQPKLIRQHQKETQ